MNKITSVQDTQGIVRQVTVCCDTFVSLLQDNKVKLVVDGDTFLGYGFDDNWDENSWIDYCPSCGKELPCHGEVVVGFD